MLSEVDVDVALGAALGESGAKPADGKKVGVSFP
jgi:hypothetical protein